MHNLFLGRLSQAALFSMVCLSVPLPGYAALTFGTSTYTPSGITGDTSQWMVAQDINADGRPDTVTIDNNADKVWIRLGGSSLSQLATAYGLSVGDGPTEGLIADFNGDGRQDIATLNTNTGGGGPSISILLASGAQGSFATATNYAVGSSPTQLVSGDFNNDGRADLACASNSTSGAGIDVLRNLGNGTFAARITLLTGTQPSGLATADFNKDNRTDLVYSTGTGASIFLASSTSSNGFANAISTNISPAAARIAAADFNGDTQVDLAVTNRFPNTEAVKVFYGIEPATGRFGGAVTFRLNDEYIWLRAVDINGDSRPDLVATDTDSSVMLMPNLGSTFGPPAYYVSDHPSRPSFADVTGDGVADMVTVDSNSFDGLIEVQPGNTLLGRWPTAVVSPYSVSRPFESVFSDLNRDGKLDVASYSYSSASGVAVALSSPDGTFTTTRTLASASTLGPASLAVGDLNKDNRPDIVVAEGSRLSVYLASGAEGNFAARTTYSTGGSARNVTIVDVDADTNADVVYADVSNDFVRVVYGQGAGVLATTAQTLAVGDQPSAVAVADVNGDNRRDVIATNYNSRTVSILLASGATRTFNAAIDIGVPRRPNDLIVTDVNQDGRVDIVTANDDDSFDTQDLQLTVLLNTAILGSFSPAQSYAAPESLKSLTARDFTSDGRPDIVARGVSNLYVLPAQGTLGAFGNALAIGGGYQLSGRISLGDYNNDATGDILVADYGFELPRLVSMPASCSDKYGCFVERQYLDFLKRAGDTAGRNYYVGLLCNGSVQPEDVANQFLSSTEFIESVGFAARCYMAIFNNNLTTGFSSSNYRIPDYAGLNYWGGVAKSSGKLAVVSGFTSSAEWTSRVGNRDNPGFVDFLFQNILGRNADASGKAYWVGQLDGGRNRNEIALSFIDSTEAKVAYANRVNAVMAYIGLLNRAAEQAGFVYHTTRLNNGTPVTLVIREFINSSEYINRLLGLGCVWPPE